MSLPHPSPSIISSSSSSSPLHIRLAFYTLGVWVGGHFPYPSSGIHGDSATKRRCHTTPHYSGTHSSRNNHSFRWLECLPQSCLLAYSSITFHGQPLPSFRGPSNRCAHAEHREHRVKRKIKRMKGCHTREISSYLDEFTWKERFGKTRRACFRNICRNIATLYPVWLWSRTVS